MASKGSEILDALVVCFAAIGGGSYNFTLTGDDRVVLGAPVGRPPFTAVYLRGAQVSSVLGQGAPLGQYRNEVRVNVVGYAVPDSAAAGTATKAAMDLLADLRRAINADRQLTTANGGTALVYDTTLEGGAFDGIEARLPGLGVVVGEVAAWWHGEQL